MNLAGVRWFDTEFQGQYLFYLKQYCSRPRELACRVNQSHSIISNSTICKHSPHHRKRVVSLCCQERKKYHIPPSEGGGVLPYKRLVGMCRWMGLHFHDWMDYNGVAFSTEFLEWGRTCSDFLG